MRIFIKLAIDGESNRTIRINLSNCANTTALIQEICKEVGVGKINIIVKLKYEPYHLILVENWPLCHYPIKNGSIFIVEFNEKYKNQENQSLLTFDKIQQQNDDYLSENSFNANGSFLSGKDQQYNSQYLEVCLHRMLHAVRIGNLEEIAVILKQQPHITDENERGKLFDQKYTFLLNQLGECGKNALHQAIIINNIDIVSFLLIKGANPAALTVDQLTPLQLAVRHHCPQIITMLLDQYKIDVNQITKEGTALHLAILNQDINTVQTLIQYDADIDICTAQGIKSIDLCKDTEIKSFLQKRVKMSKMKIPTISKGPIYKVSSLAYRLKEKVMTINPFKEEFIIQGAQKQIQDKHSISSISNVEQIEQKSWLMKDQIFYFKISLKESEKKEIMIGLRHEKTFLKWISNLRHAMRYIQCKSFTKPVSAKEQIIQIINDQKNQITLHKRKVDNIPNKSKNMSIMNLPTTDQTKQPNYFMNGANSTASSNPHIQNKVENSFVSVNREDFDIGSVIPGSILGYSTLSQSDNSPKLPISYEEVREISIEDQKNSLSAPNFEEEKPKFRKNSEKMYAVSVFHTQEKPNISFHDFQIIKLLGNGSFGKVYLSKYNKTKKVYALKVLNKKKLMVKKQLKYAVGQANILKKVDFPFIIKLYYAFQTPLNIYMALENCTNGDLSEIIIVKEKLSQSTAQFVIAQVILAIQYLHSKNIIYRDLKPENILIATDGYVRLTDFGLSKQNCFSMSFCGSPAYLSPQMLNKKGVGFQSDIYGIGTVLFQMVVGQPAFYDDNLQKLYEKIKLGKLKYPSYLSIQIKSLISNLLQKDISKRIGVKDFNEIKKHDFFKRFNWNSLQNKSIPAPNELFINQQDNEHFQPVKLQREAVLTIDDTDYDKFNCNMVSRIKNFTFARQQVLVQNRRKLSCTNDIQGNCFCC